MKQLLLIVIKLYWVSIPKKNRRPCLFKETCSQFVYRQTKELGFFEGIRALISRYKKCRKGYQLHHTNHGFVMELVDGTLILEKDISPNIIDPIFIEIEYKSKSIIEEFNHRNNKKSSP